MTAPNKKKQKVVHHEEKEPEFNVQINEPRMLRKDLLESVREIIIFMQGFDKFKKIQEDKVALFSKLKGELREINTLVDSHLRKHVPKGKLRSIGLTSDKPLVVQSAPVDSVPAASEQPSESMEQHASDLDQLESQLKDIEMQLNRMN